MHYSNNCVKHTHKADIKRWNVCVRPLQQWEEETEIQFRLQWQQLASLFEPILTEPDRDHHVVKCEPSWLLLPISKSVNMVWNMLLYVWCFCTWQTLSVAARTGVNLLCCQSAVHHRKRTHDLSLWLMTIIINKMKMILLHYLYIYYIIM